MSQNRTLTSLVSVVALIGVAGLFAAACGEKTPGEASCGEISARMEALNASADALTEVSAGIKSKVVSACAQLADMPAPTGVASDGDVRTLCNAAKARLDAALAGSVTLTIVPPKCSVNAQAQFDCEAKCQAEADLECTPPSLDVRCDPGDLSVQCNGTCKVGASCEGTAEVAVDCQGKCEGSCSGTCTGKCTGTCQGTCSGGTGENGQCDGTCSGTCTGECDANCMGGCKGSCEITAQGGVQCSGEARCKGGCDVAGTAPKCEGELKPAQCTGGASVDCSGDCEASASLDAECSEPSITIVGDMSAELRTDVMAAVPALLKVSGQSTLALKAVTDLGKNVADVAGGVGGCALELGTVATQFVAAASATAQASASVSVSFEASASVSGSAAGG